MDISLEMVVKVVIYLIVAGAIFGLLYWLIGYCEREFPMVQPFAKVARILLMIFAVLIVIALLLSFIGHPIVTLH
jgi:uncharacterized membrane protein